MNAHHLRLSFNAPPIHDRDRFREACGPFEESTRGEWDAFEAAWSDVPERVREYERYRGVLGFGWVAL